MKRKSGEIVIVLKRAMIGYWELGDGRICNRNGKVGKGFWSLVGGLVFGVGGREEEIYSGRSYLASLGVFPASKAKALTKKGGFSSISHIVSVSQTILKREQMMEKNKVNKVKDEKSYKQHNTCISSGPSQKNVILL